MDRRRRGVAVVALLATVGVGIGGLVDSAQAASKPPLEEFLTALLHGPTTTTTTKPKPKPRARHLQQPNRRDSSSLLAKEGR